VLYAKDSVDLDGIQLWGKASNSNIEITQRYQSKTLRRILNAPWYVTNKVIHADCKIPSVREEISKFSQNYQFKIENHPNSLALGLNLPDNSQCRPTYRLRRHHILHLIHRFA
jgi:hypothetical protein